MYITQNKQEDLYQKIEIVFHVDKQTADYCSQVNNMSWFIFIEQFLSAFFITKIKNQ